MYSLKVSTVSAQFSSGMSFCTRSIPYRFVGTRTLSMTRVGGIGPLFAVSHLVVATIGIALSWGFCIIPSSASSLCFCSGPVCFAVSASVLLVAMSNIFGIDSSSAYGSTIISGVAFFILLLRFLSLDDYLAGIRFCC